MEARTLEELPTWAAGLLAAEPVGHLGLLDSDGNPRVLPVTFALFRGEIWSAVDEKPKRRGGERVARVGWLRERPQSALTVDHYDADWTRLAWVQVLGRTSIVDVEGREDVLAALAARYPDYSTRAPGGPLLRLAPDRVLCWRARG